jgi:AcrR family transcriptional regulator
MNLLCQRIGGHEGISRLLWHFYADVGQDPNDLHLPLVCVGTNEAKQALMTDQQLADRFEARELAAWRDDTAFHQLLASFGSTLPLRRASVGPAAERVISD